MAKTHTVKQGEHLSGITDDHDFRDFHTIWDHPKNAGLKMFRDPHVLFPGDKLFIPDRTLKQVERPTDALHTLQVNIRKLFLRVQVLDLDNRPVKKADGKVALEPDKPDPVSTDEKGILRGATLTGTYLFGADLFETDLGESNLAGANLRKANLSGGVGS